jgi:hypothetical protein
MFFPPPLARGGQKQVEPFLSPRILVGEKDYQLILVQSIIAATFEKSKFVHTVSPPTGRKRVAKN